MIIYNIFMNLIEGLMLSMFIAYYLNMRDKFEYTMLGTLLCLIQFTFLDYSNSLNNLLLLSVIVILFVLLLKDDQKHIYEKAIVCLIAGIIFYMGSILTLSLMSILLHMSSIDIYQSVSYLVVYDIVTRVVSGLICVVICRHRIDINKEMSSKLGITYITICVAIIFILAYMFKMLFTMDVSIYISMIMMASMLLVSVLFVLLFRRYQSEINNQLRYEHDLARNKFNNENYSKMKHMSSEIVEVEHRMKYVLMSIKHYIDSDQVEKASYMLDNYIKNVENFESVINTHNPYFDFIISTKISEYKYEDVYIKLLLSIKEHDLYNSEEFCNLMVGLLDLFKDHLIIKDSLSLKMVQDSQFVIIELIGNIGALELSKDIIDKLNYYEANYIMEHIDDIYSLRFTIEVNEN